ncbi:MAG: murein hydrolase activator EnvC family protein [Bacillota bacterium]|jgi:murein DD-endopeptidase MepM/ murein hydrolase activator NlpD
MGSLNDYEYCKPRSRSEKNRFGGFGKRFLAQSVVAVILLLVVVNFTSSETILGDFSRYVGGDALELESSWINYDALLAASTSDDSTIPEFVVPVSGVVIKKFQLEGEPSGQSSGIIINSEAGNSVKAVADGTILSTGGEKGNMWITISHSGGFVSIYQGLDQIQVQQGQKVKSADAVGLMGETNLAFALKQNDIPVDPLVWLFNQEANPAKENENAIKSEGQSNTTNNKSSKVI